MNKISIKQTDDIYEEVSTWWTERNFPVVIREVLPETAMVVEDGTTLLAILFIYNTDSSVKWVAYPTTNPLVSKSKREGVLDYLFSQVQHIIPNSFIFTTSGTEPVIKSLHNSGFTEGDSEITHFIKIT